MSQKCQEGTFLNRAVWLLLIPHVGPQTPINREASPYNQDECREEDSRQDDRNGLIFKQSAWQAEDGDFWLLGIIPHRQRGTFRKAFERGVWRPRLRSEERRVGKECRSGWTECE